MVMKEDFNHLLNPNKENKLEKFIEVVKTIRISCYNQAEFRDIVDVIAKEVFKDE